MKLPDRIRKARNNLNLSQKEVAALIGTYQQRYAHWETGHTRPDPDEIRKLSEVFGVSSDWLLGEDSDTKAYSTDFDKEFFLLRQELQKYGTTGVKKMRKIIPIIFEKDKAK